MWSGFDMIQMDKSCFKGGAAAWGMKTFYITL
jgi:hypothetical protein